MDNYFKMNFWFFICIGLFVGLLGCATTPVPTKTNAAPDFKDILGLLGDMPVKHTPPCLINGCEYQLTDIDEATAKDFDLFVKSAQANNVTLINITINSLGGSVDDGWNIIHTLENAHLESICTVDRQAFSMGFAILQSCNQRYGKVTSTYMAHEIKVSIKARMSQTDLENAAAMVAVDNQALANQITKRLKITPAQYQERVHNREYWLSPQQALDIGAIDRIVK